MFTMQVLIALSTFGSLKSVTGAFSETGPFPPSYATFSSGFVQPEIPDVVTDFQGHFIQHKWDNNVSHISSGYWYNSAAQGKVRVDETFEGSLASSLFDYTNITAEGRILNKLWEIHPSVGSTPTCFVEHLQNPAFPLVTVDLLKVNQAIFGGVVNDPLVGYTQSWNFIFGDSIPVIVYLDVDNLLVGFDFWGAERRTKVLTRFFNNAVRSVDAKVFEDFPC